MNAELGSSITHQRHFPVSSISLTQLIHACIKVIIFIIESYNLQQYKNGSNESSAVDSGCGIVHTWVDRS